MIPDSMDIEFQLNNKESVTQHDLQYDPLLEQTEFLELDDLFDKELSASNNEPLVYESSLIGTESVPDPLQEGEDEGYVDPAPALWSWVDSTDYEDENDPAAPQSIPRDSTFRLTVIERTLEEIQKYIGELLLLVREELQKGDTNTEITCDDVVPLFDTDKYDLLQQSEEREYVSFANDLSPERDSFSIDLPPDRYTGVFTGQAMVTSDGTEFSVPENYASKSHMVEGDVLKLTITPEGKMIYKQLAPVPRRRITGILEHDPVRGSYSVLCAQGRFRVLRASVVFFKGVPGDEVLLIIPVGGPYRWGAIQAIIGQTQ